MDEIQSMAETSNDTSGIDVDSLLSQIESGGSIDEAPAQNTQVESNSSQQAAQAQAAKEYEWMSNGKLVKVLDSDPRAKQWMQQGHDYAQKMADFNKQRQDWQSKETWAKEVEGRYKPIDDYVRDNPQFWDHVTQSWQEKQGGQQSQGFDQNNPIIKQYEEKLNRVEQFIQNQEQEKISAQRVQEDTALEGEIKSIREQYPDLDFAASGPEGTSLENRVLEHAVKNGIKSFKTAFRDLLHDDLLKKAEERGKETIAKDIQKRKTTGLLGTSPTPTKGLSAATDIKNKSYDQLIEEARAEYGIG